MRLILLYAPSLIKSETTSVEDLMELVTKVADLVEKLAKDLWMGLGKAPDAARGCFLIYREKLFKPVQPLIGW